MRPIEKYLDEVKEKAGIKTDRELAERLGVKPSAICHIKNGENTPSEEHCKRLAALAGDPYEKVLLLAQVSKAHEGSKLAWERILKYAAKGGLALGLCALWYTGHLPDQDTLPLLGASLTTSHTLDIMSNILPALAALPVLMYSLMKLPYPPRFSA